MVGRRGSIGMMYEIIISLVLLLFFASTIFVYIDSNASGAAYWSVVYTADLATTADIVNAGYGDVLLRYDNLKRNLDLTFTSISEGEIGVGPTGGNSVIGYYGLPDRFPRPAEFVNPSFLALRKIHGGFALTETEFILESCPYSEPTVPVTSAFVFLEAPEEVRQTFTEILDTTKIQLANEDDASIIIRLTVTESANNAVQFQPTNTDGGQLACLFAQKLKLLGLTSFESNEPVTTGSTFTLVASISTDVNKETIGRSLAFALAEVYA